MSNRFKKAFEALRDIEDANEGGAAYRFDDEMRTLYNLKDRIPLTPYDNGGSSWLETRVFLLPGQLKNLRLSQDRNAHPEHFRFPIAANLIYGSQPEKLIAFLERMI